MLKKPLPTGEEPPKGYESLIRKKPLKDEVQIDCAFISQLAKIELKEIESMRRLAFSGVSELAGLTNEVLPFDQELDVLPNTEASDKLLFRARKNKSLIGYALVVTRWPHKDEWVIQHLIVHPKHRSQGVGTSLVKKIENYALRSEVKATRILAVPVEESGSLFWHNNGYLDESGRLPINVDGLDHELITYRKEL